MRTKAWQWLSAALGSAALGALGYWVRRQAQRAPASTGAQGERVFATHVHIVDIVEEGSLESFPASDPPSTMTPTTSVGRAD